MRCCRPSLFLKSLGAIAIAALLVVVTSPRHEPDPLDEAARTLMELHNEGDESLTERFDTGLPMLELTTWLHEQIGNCRDYELYRAIKPNRARFLYECERGQLEAEMRVDAKGRVTKLRIGARGLEPPAEVRTAAKRWLASPEGRAEAADCHIDRVDLGNSRGALFVLGCPTEEKTLLIDLDLEGDIRRLKVIDHATDEWRIPGAA